MLGRGQGSEEQRGPTEDQSAEASGRSRLWKEGD